MVVSLAAARSERAELARLRAWLGADAAGLSDEQLAMLSWEADVLLQVVMGMCARRPGAEACRA